MRLSVACSSMLAHHPMTRLDANVGVNISRGSPQGSITTPAWELDVGVDLPSRHQLGEAKFGDRVPRCSPTPVQALITAIGTSVREEFNIENARYHKIILMSVDGQEHVFVRDGDGVRMTTIAEFIDPLVEDRPAGPQGYVKRVREPMGEVLSFSPESGSVHFNTIKGVIRHDVDEPLYEVGTMYGRSVRITASHSIYAYEDGEIRPKRGDEIRPGDLVVAPRRIPLPETAPDRIDLLTELHKHPDAARQVWVRGPAVRQWAEEKILAEHAHNPQLTEPRVEAPEEVRSELAAMRRRSGISQRQLCQAVGIRQPVTFYAWEKGTSRPTVSHWDAYVAAVGGNVASTRRRITVCPSSLERNWRTQYHGARRNRLRNEVRLSDLTTADVEMVRGTRGRMAYA